MSGQPEQRVLVSQADAEECARGLRRENLIPAAMRLEAILTSAGVDLALPDEMRPHAYAVFLDVAPQIVQAWTDGVQRWVRVLHLTRTEGGYAGGRFGPQIDEDAWWAMRRAREEHEARRSAADATEAGTVPMVDWYGSRSALYDFVKEAGDRVPRLQTRVMGTGGLRSVAGFTHDLGYAGRGMTDFPKSVPLPIPAVDGAAEVTADAASLLLALAEATETWTDHRQEPSEGQNDWILVRAMALRTMAAANAGRTVTLDVSPGIRGIQLTRFIAMSGPDPLEVA